MNRVAFLCLFVVSVILLTERVRADEPDLKDRYRTLIVEDFQVQDDTIVVVFRKLTEAVEKRRQGTSVGIVLVKPDAELLRKRITRNFQHQSLEKILAELCIIADLHYSLDYHVIIVGGKDVDLSKRGLRLEDAREGEIAETGMRIVLSDLDFSGTDFSAAVKTVEVMSSEYNATGKPFRVESKLSFAGVEPKVYAWFPYVLSGEAIEYFCMSADLRYSSPAEGVYILLNK